MFKFIVLVTLIAVASAHSECPASKMFAGFLVAHPEIKAQFPKFKDVADADLATNADLADHADKIYTIIKSLVGRTNWDDIDQLSAFHKSHGITNKEWFVAFRNYCFNVLNASWDKFFEHLFSKF
jgi:hypothetical protein